MTLKKVVFLPNSSKVATFLQKNHFFPCCFVELFCVKIQAYVLQILKYVKKYSSYLFIYLFICIYIATQKKHWMHAWIDPHPDFRVLESREAGWMDGWMILILILGFWSSERLDGWRIFIWILGFRSPERWMDGRSSSGF